MENDCRQLVLTANHRFRTSYCAGVKLTDFWERLEQAVGEDYARSWAKDHVLTELDGRTVEQALAAGEDTRTVWLAVYRDLELPLKFR